MDSSIQKLISDLQFEFNILRKLLYRNKNQHGNTNYFSYLKQCLKLSRYISFEKISEIYHLLATTSINIDKVSKLCVNNSLTLLCDARKVIQLSVMTVENALKASEFLMKKLSQRVFVPLFSACLAICSRISHLFSGIIRLFYNQYSSLISQVKIIAIKKTKFEKSINTYLCSINELVSVEYSCLFKIIIDNVTENIEGENHSICSDIQVDSNSFNKVDETNENNKCTEIQDIAMMDDASNYIDNIQMESSVMVDTSIFFDTAHEVKNEGVSNSNKSRKKIKKLKKIKESYEEDKNEIDDIFSNF